MPRVITHSAVGAAGAASKDAGDRGCGHLVKTGGGWASIFAAAAAERLHGSATGSAGGGGENYRPAATAWNVPCQRRAIF